MNAMTPITPAQIAAEIKARIFPNGVGAITAARLEQVLLDIVNVCASLVATAVAQGETPIALAGFLTSNVRQAARPVVEANGGSMPAFFAGFIGPGAQTDGTADAYWAVYAPPNGVLYGALAAYLTAPATAVPPGLGMTATAAAMAMATIYATASSYGDQSGFANVPIGDALGSTPGPAGPAGPAGPSGPAGATGPAGSAAASNVVATVVCAGPILQGAPVFVDRASKLLKPARADTYPNAFVLGLAGTLGAQGFAVAVLAGSVALPDWSGVTTPSATDLSPGVLYYLAPTGGLTTTPPVNQPGVSIVTVGRAADARTLDVTPSNPILQ